MEKVENSHLQWFRLIIFSWGQPTLYDYDRDDDGHDLHASGCVNFHGFALPTRGHGWSDCDRALLLRHDLSVAPSSNQ